jgi:hypothetical protein
VRRPTSHPANLPGQSERHVLPKLARISPNGPCALAQKPCFLLPGKSLILLRQYPGRGPAEKHILGNLVALR